MRERGADDLDEGSGASVNQLVIQNKGKVPIYVLAGTIVKGGNQDRQIAQDFIVAANTTTSVDAFCVEHGRWTATREGVTTGGKFEALGQLATSKVRAAGQYERNQVGVWDEVGKVNAKSGKDAPSGTLLATVDDKDLVERRTHLAQEIDRRLAKTNPNRAVVGIAYAVGAQVKGVRWFANHQLFETFREILTSTAAMDSLSVVNGSKLPAPAPAAIARFVKDVERASAEERATPAENVNEYKKGKNGYGSSTKLKASSKAKARAVSKDYLVY